jgi:hypothetical protein
MSRIAATFLTVVVALTLSAPVAAADHPPKPKPKHHHKHKAKKKPRRPKVVAPPAMAAGLPVTITLLEGSTATLDMGDGQARTVPLSGGATGLILGGYRLNRDNVVRLQGATVKLGAAPVLTDSCPAPPAAVDPISALQMDRLKGNNLTIHRDGSVTAAVGAFLKLVLDTRAGDCGAPVSATGFATTALIVRPAGTISPLSGLAGLELDSPPQQLAISACLAPGSPTLACSAAPVAVPATLRTHLVVNLKIG